MKCTPAIFISQKNETDAAQLYFWGFVPNVQKYSQQTEVNLCDLHTEIFMAARDGHNLHLFPSLNE